MTRYKVTWEVEIETPAGQIGAAQHALNTLLDPEARIPSFQVTNLDTEVEIGVSLWEPTDFEDLPEITRLTRELTGYGLRDENAFSILLTSAIYRLTGAAVFAPAKKEPYAFGCSPEVSELLKMATNLGIVWDIEDDKLLVVEF